MRPDGSIMKPEPSDVTWRGADLSFCKFLNRSASGEPGGRSGSASCSLDGFKVCVVDTFTTDGKSLFERSENESGAGRAIAGAANTRANNTARIRNFI